MEFKQSLAKLIQEEDLSEAEMIQATGAIMEGEATPAQIGGFLTALRLKGETVEEITGAARVMREKALKVDFQAPLVIDTCGTGGDGANTFNISTTAAFIIAAAGIPVAKHGNRAASGNCGSADLLEELGIKIAAPPEKVKLCLERVGFGFMFAPVYHLAMKHAVGPRKELGFRTIFNLLGPLTNPAGANCQLIGVCRPDLTEIFTKVLQKLGVERAMVVHGGGGLDELSLEGENTCCLLRQEQITSFTFKASDYGLQTAPNVALQGGNSSRNAGFTENILNGTLSGPMRDVVILNAAAGFYLTELVPDLAAGARLARELISDGSASRKLRQLREIAV